MSATLSHARMHVQRGWAVVPVPQGQKGPRERDWPRLRLTVAELHRYFPDGSNIGLLNGEPSNGLNDIDLDPDTTVLLAPKFLPDTGLISGRETSPRSHWWYYSDPPAPTRQFSDPVAKGKDAMLVEYRSTGTQTLVAPSIHPADGDSYCWNVEAEPATIPGAVLVAAAAKLAACSLLARYWAEGKRHNLALATAGMLLRAGCERQTVEHFILCAARAAGDTDMNDGRSAVHATLDALSSGKRASGIPTMKRLLAAAIVDSITLWLDLTEREPQPDIALGVGSEVPGDRNSRWPDRFRERSQTFSEIRQRNSLLPRMVELPGLEWPQLGAGCCA